MQSNDTRIALRRCHRHVTAALLCTLLFAAGCAAPGQRQPDATPPVRGLPEVAPETTAPPPTTTASPTLALRQDSARAAADGDFYRAVALLERAIRIEPSEPRLWLDLARLHLAHGDLDDAEQFARKALTLTRDHPALEQEAWLIIDQVQALEAPPS
jgi:tetratricopeptide (TPR) repeat protein